LSYLLIRTSHRKVQTDKQAVNSGHTALSFSQLLKQSECQLNCFALDWKAESLDHVVQNLGKGYPQISHCDGFRIQLSVESSSQLCVTMLTRAF
jgi:hypothetical protein